MSITRHKRQILLFLVAILAPAGVLIGLSARMMYQERELSIKRAADQRRAAVEQCRRETKARLEAIRFQEINRLMRSSPSPQDAENPAVVFAAALKDDTLVMPWQVSPPEYSSEFAKALQRGETEELVKKNPPVAATEYRLALTLGRSPRETRTRGCILLERFVTLETQPNRIACTINCSTIPLRLGMPRGLDTGSTPRSVF